MIVGAGLGTRLRPFTRWLPKPALPVRGLPLIAYPLALLASAGVREVVINVHHLSERLVQAARRWCPAGLELHFSPEPELLLTGGAIRRVAAFLRGSDPCLVLGGDMVVDVDLRALVARHVRSGRDVTLLLKDDPRAQRFGTIGIDQGGRVRRIAGRFDLGEERRAGIYTWVNVISARALDTLPDRETFNHLDDWLAPRLAKGAGSIGAEVLAGDDLVWEPVGTPAEYLAANLCERRLSYLDVASAAREAGVRLEPGLVIGAGARLGVGAKLSRAVVWDGEEVPAGFVGSDGVFAAGGFHACRANVTEGAG